MATEAEIEAAARERYIRTHVRAGFTREKADQWWGQCSRAPGGWILQELDDARAALDAAAAVQSAGAATTKWNDEPDPGRDWYITIAEIAADIGCDPSKEAILSAIATMQEAHLKNHGALLKINDIRNSIIGAQTINWSEHIYPLVAALEQAGIEGMPYPEARKNVGTLLERNTALEAALRPFAEYADPRGNVPAHLQITSGSSIARRQLTMGHCYTARAALTGKEPR